MERAPGIDLYQFTAPRVAASMSSAVTSAKRSEAPDFYATALN
jgi:hypothetical protein